MAREEVRRCRQLLLNGIDPIAHRNGQRVQAADAVRKVRTFRDCAIEYHATHSTGWRNQKHGKQSIDSLSTRFRCSVTRTSTMSGRPIS
jgi:hypothetical protein